MVPQLAMLLQQRGRRQLLQQLPSRHLHVMPAHGRHGCTDKPSPQAGALPRTPSSAAAAQVWPPRKSRLSNLASPLVAPAWPLLLDKCEKRGGWMDAQEVATVDVHGSSSAESFPWSSPWLGFGANQMISGSPGLEEKRVLTPEHVVKKLCEQGQIKQAIEVLEEVVAQGMDCDKKHLLYSVLKQCMAQKNLMLGGQVHALAMRMGLGSSDTLLCNHLIRMYAGRGKLQEAMDVFRGVAVPDVFMWSSVISAHVKQGQAERAIQLYQHLRASMEVKPNGHVLVAALQACAAAGDLQSGKQVHRDVLSSGAESNNMFVCNCLVDMYAKCGSLEDARKVFDGLGDKDVVTWNAMMAGYARVAGMGQEALRLHSAMMQTAKGSMVVVAPNAVTFVCLLQACADVGVAALGKGKELHSQVKGCTGLESNVVVGGSLVNMYSKCGSVEDARRVFEGLGEKNVVTWNAMVAGYAQRHQQEEGSIMEDGLEEALSLFNAMMTQNEQGGCSSKVVAPNVVTFACLLQACANVGVAALETGKLLHSQLLKEGNHHPAAVVKECDVGGSLVNMYAKCGSLKDARRVFDRLSDKKKCVVTWTAMIAGYAGQHEEEKGGSMTSGSQEALNIYSSMRKSGTVAPDAVTYVCLLDACGSVGALQLGKQLHSEIREAGLESNLRIGNCLVKMYAKCGCLEASRQVFDKLPVKDLVTWNALLKGYSEHGEGRKAIECFEQLLRLQEEEQQQLKGGVVQPDEVTYTCLITACSHASLVDQGQRYFEAMGPRHGVTPTSDQLYCCLVDLLGRSGHLDRAEQVLRASGLSGNPVGWRALLSACKSYGDAETGRRCFEHLVELEPTVASAYVLLSSIYANVGRWDEVGWVESMRRAAGARKKAAKACIEVKDEVHEFTVGEERSDVAATLRKMSSRAKQGGHVPQTQLVLRANVSEQEKEDALCGHAEKLALAYGLLHTPAGATLVVTKNLRMCGDCHSSTKVMSRVEKREVVVRDGHKVHRFRNGACSCLDRP